MAPVVPRDLQLTSILDGSDDHEEVCLLDSFSEDAEEGGREETERKRKEKKRWLRKIELRIVGMMCLACTNSVQTVVAWVRGVANAFLSLLQNKASVLFDLNSAEVSGKERNFDFFYYGFWVLFGIRDARSSRVRKIPGSGSALAEISVTSYGLRGLGFHVVICVCF